MKAITVWMTVVLAVVCGIYASMTSKPTESVSVIDAANELRPEVTSRTKEKEARHFFDSLDSNTPAPALSIDVPLDSTLQSELDKISNSKDPNEKFRAYGLIKRCMEFKSTGRFYIEDKTGSVEDHKSEPVFRTASGQEVPKVIKFCGDLTEITKRSRLDYLADAASGGIANADVNFMIEGPFGDPSALESRPNDPLVVEWRKKALSLVQENADRGVIPSIKLLQIGYSEGLFLYEKQPLLALTYGYVLEQLAASHAEELTDLKIFSEVSSKIKTQIPDEDYLAKSKADQIVKKIRERARKD